MAGNPYNDNVKEPVAVTIKEPKWGNGLNYKTSPLPKDNPVGKIPPRTEISAHGKDLPHTPSPSSLSMKGE